ncbi:MAG: ABC transporter substrate-binding protein [Candidatus Gracilibacteria bacterium]|nr:ABC transporter substrate-binding protein [Candidatus Gracilibacteria bacterium]
MKGFLLKISKIFFVTLFVAGFLFVLMELFVGDFGKMKEKISGFLNFERGDNFENSYVLKVVYPDEPSVFEPTHSNPTSKQRLANVYESLVRTDRNLKIKSSLALTWGLLDDTTWEFKLRPNVQFHNGSDFDAMDVKMSLERAKTFSTSELIGQTETIESIEILDDLTLKIVTKKPDPLLLQKLAMVLILPSEYWNDEIKVPIGTGPYRFESLDEGVKTVLKRFEDYWGKKSLFEKVELYTSFDKFERVRMLMDGSVDLLVFVPYDGVSIVKDEGFNISAVPSLEVQFLVFNTKSPLMKDLDNRRIVSLALSQDALVEAVGGYARKSNQFVSSGVTGFNSKISEHIYDLSLAKKLAEERGLTSKTVQFHLVKGLTVLGDYVKSQLEQIGVNVIVSYLETDDFFKSMEAGKADFYFLGFKSEIGDSLSFLQFLAHSQGSYAYWGYKNEYLDRLVEDSVTEMDALSRRKNLQEAMKILMEDDFFGVPLFEYETVYAFNDKIDFNPRIDGVVIFDEFTIN